MKGALVLNLNPGGNGQCLGHNSVLWIYSSLLLSKTSNFCCLRDPGIVSQRCGHFLADKTCDAEDLAGRSLQCTIKTEIFHHSVIETMLGHTRTQLHNTLKSVTKHHDPFDIRLGSPSDLCSHQAHRGGRQLPSPHLLDKRNVVSKMVRKGEEICANLLFLFQVKASWNLWNLWNLWE